MGSRFCPFGEPHEKGSPAAGRFSHRWLVLCVIALGFLWSTVGLAAYGGPAVEVVSRAVQVDDMNTYYEETRRVGTMADPAVLLIHGLGGSGRVWELVAPDLARAGYTVYSIDLPGFGRSDVPPRVFSVLEYPAFIAEFMRTIGVEKAALVGNSMGGYIAWVMAAHYSDMVSALVLVDAAGIPLPDTLPESLRRLKPWVSPTAGQEAGVGALIPGLKWFIGLDSTSVITREIARPFIEDGFIDRTAIGPYVYQSLYQSFKEARIIFQGRLNFEVPPPDWQELLESLRMPTFIQWGTQDPVLSLGDAYLFASLIPGATIQLYPAVGHMPMLETPEPFLQDLVAFLAQAEAPPAAVSSDGQDPD